MIALRLNRNHRLVSYPLGMRFAQSNDAIGFRNLNRNPLLLLDEITLNCYSTAVIFTKKNESNTSLLLTKVHQDFTDWCNRLKTRKVLEGDRINFFNPQHLTSENTKEYGAAWTPCPAEAGSIRFSLLTIACGAKGFTNIELITVYPMLMAVDGKGELEIPGCDNVTEVAHWAQKAPMILQRKKWQG